MVIEPANCTVEHISKKLSRWFPERKDKFESVCQIFKPSFINGLDSKVRKEMKDNKIDTGKLDKLILNELRSNFKEKPVYEHVKDNERFIGLVIKSAIESIIYDKSVVKEIDNMIQQRPKSEERDLKTAKESADLLDSFNGPFLSSLVSQAFIPKGHENTEAAREFIGDMRESISKHTTDLYVEIRKRIGMKDNH